MKYDLQTYIGYSKMKELIDLLLFVRDTLKKDKRGKWIGLTLRIAPCLLTANLGIIYFRKDLPAREIYASANLL